MSAPASTGNPLVGDDALWLVDGAVRGWKVARLHADADGAVALTGVTADVPYGAADVARCGRIATHVPPQPGCRCGFYAWRHRPSATRLLGTRQPALVEVELLGRFDEYDLGFVAAAQRVARVDLLDVCAACFADGAVERAVTLGRPTAHAQLLAACARHAQALEEVTDLSGFAARLGAPVTWLARSPALQAHLEFALRLLDPPARHRLGQVEDLRPGEVGHVFAEGVVQDAEGQLWLSRTATLVQPLEGRDVPVRRRLDGDLELLLEGIVLPGFRPLRKRSGDELIAHTTGEPIPLRHGARPE